MQEKAVYPRWRGEHLASCNALLNSFGLSPLARGTLAERHKRSHPERFIPAGAGNTRKRRYDELNSPVYPRWRGEHAPHQRRYLLLRGLSPLARGTRDGDYEFRLAERFIPAGAGNTPSTLAISSIASVYPRWRGEHFRSCYFYLYKQRFIPAGAGNTGMPSRRILAPTVYPRWRGEHVATEVTLEFEDGLSPLARGTRLRPVVSASSSAVYPRWRGEHRCIADFI